MEKVEIIGYHATPYDCAKKICDDKFLVNYNPKHWLGNGIYFYVDYLLAKWWNTKPSSEFGSDGNNRVIVTCELSIASKQVLDITTLKGYQEYAAFYEHYFGMIQRYSEDGINLKKLRCAFFDWLMESKDKHFFIAPFHLPKKPYLPEVKAKYFHDLDISYSEVQICLDVRWQHIIQSKRIEKL